MLHLLGMVLLSICQAPALACAPSRQSNSSGFSPLAVQTVPGAAELPAGDGPSFLGIQGVGGLAGILGQNGVCISTLGPAPQLQKDWSR